MPTYEPHWLAQIGGTFFGVEQWSMNIRFKTAGGEVASLEPPIDAANAVKIAQDIYNDTRTFMTETGSVWSSAAKMTYVKFNKIDANGHYMDQKQTNIYENTSGQTGLRTPAPPQLALAVTLLTDQKRGRASKGRIFIPVGNVSVDSNGRVSTSDRDALATQAAKYFKNLSEWPGIETVFGQLKPVICSGLDGSWNRITGVAVGDVIDTQRRRRGKLRENYKVVSL